MNLSVISVAILSSFGTASLIAFVGWLGKTHLKARLESSIKNVYDRDLEQFKAGLKSAADKEIEILRSSLNHEKSFSSARRDADVELYRRFLTVLPSDGAIEFLKNQGFEGVFEGSPYWELDEFNNNWHRPEFNFHDEDIEKAKSILLQLAQEIRVHLATVVFKVADISGDYYGIYPDHRKTREPHFVEAAEKAERLADDVVTAYNTFISLARRKLAC